MIDDDDIIDFREENKAELDAGSDSDEVELETESGFVGGEIEFLPTERRVVSGIDGSDIDWTRELAVAEGGAIDDFNDFREAHGLPPVDGSGGGRDSSEAGRKRIRSFSISDKAMDGLRYLATELKVAHGAGYSVSGLLELIGTYRLELVDRRRRQRKLGE